MWLEVSCWKFESESASPSWKRRGRTIVSAKGGERILDMFVIVHARRCCDGTRRYNVLPAISEYIKV